MRKICLTVFLIFSASLILSAGPLSGTGILLQTPPGGDDISLPGDPELVKVLPAPALVDPAMLKEPLPGMAWKRQEFYFCYIRIYGGILALKGFGRVYSLTLTNMTTGQSMSVDRNTKIALRNEDEEDLFVGLALFAHHGGTYLTEADAVAPALAVQAETHGDGSP